LLCVVAAAVLPCHWTQAGVVVLSNQTSARIAVTIIEPDGRRTEYKLEPRGVVPVAAETAVAAEYADGGKPRRQTLRPSGIYCFRGEAGRIELLYEELPGRTEERPEGASAPPPREDVHTITVKILADDKEPTVRRIWEKRYRQRLAEASAIIERYCRVRFEVVAVGTWNSSDAAEKLQELAAEFEREVKPDPAQLAIGFTARHQGLADERRMGGARGPLRPHIIIREWGQQLAEPDRLEILVHELGHFLGAVHSPEEQSAMLPDIGNRRARSRAFQIGFDARNTLAMYLIGEELRRSDIRPPTHLGRLSATTKDELRAVYRALAVSMPGDDSAARYLAVLDQSLGLAVESPERLRAAVAGARTVVGAVVESARQNRHLPEKARAAAGEPFRLEGDELSEYYVRRAAASARQLPPGDAAGAFLLALGAALDDTDIIRDALVIGPLWRQIESASERDERLAVLGAPTMRSRRDLTRHFAVSAALAALVGPQAAEGAGILKEMADSRRGSGFSFVDLSADLAGVFFAEAVGTGRLPLARLEHGFAVADFLPDPTGLKEGIDWDDFVASYGETPDRRLFDQREAIRKRILALPGYK
jgi:hypothetical protein